VAIRLFRRKGQAPRRASQALSADEETRLAEILEQRE